MNNDDDNLKELRLTHILHRIEWHSFAGVINPGGVLLLLSISLALNPFL